MQEVFRAIARLPAHITVLIMVNRVPGKSWSPAPCIATVQRAPFIALNMAAIPRDLLVGTVRS